MSELDKTIEELEQEVVELDETNGIQEKSPDSTDYHIRPIKPKMKRDKESRRCIVNTD